MKVIDYRRHAKPKPLEALAFRSASAYEPALEGLTRAYVSKLFIRERDGAGEGVGNLVRAALARLDEKGGGEPRWSYTKTHSVDVARLSYAMALEAKAQRAPGAEKLEPALALAGGLVHDVGKTFLPLAIIVKELGVDFSLFTAFRGAPLNDAEKRIMREEHISIGTRFVRLFGGGEHIRTILDMVGLHHVMYNGKDSGVPSYPSLIRGADLPLHARIAKTADFISAVMPRHYRTNGYISSLEGAAAYAITASGTELDPFTVRCFLSGFYCISPESAARLIRRLAHPLGEEGVRDIHNARLYTRDVVMKDAEFRGTLASPDRKKEAWRAANIAECMRSLGLDAGSVGAN